MVLWNLLPTMNVCTSAHLYCKTNSNPNIYIQVFPPVVSFICQPYPLHWSPCSTFYELVKHKKGNITQLGDGNECVAVRLRASCQPLFIFVFLGTPPWRHYNHPSPDDRGGFVKSAIWLIGRMLHQYESQSVKSRQHLPSESINCLLFSGSVF